MNEASQGISGIKSQHDFKNGFLFSFDNAKVGQTSPIK